jgi:hypothetical protein
MIRDFAKFLRKLQMQEQREIARQNISHAPTIGAMYEGLTKEILNLALPRSADLRLVSGFVSDHRNQLSRQIDCMLVSGKGRRIPHTGSYVWPIQNVIAVFEVKKNLYAAELRESEANLKSVLDSYKSFIQENEVKSQKAGFIFSGITGRLFRNDISLPSETDEALFHEIRFEMVAPIRIVFAYEGYSDEGNFRAGFAGYCERELFKRLPNIVPYDFPNLIVCGENSIVKLNGMPYIFSLVDDWRIILASSPENPLRLLIRLIWHRIGMLTDFEVPPEIQFFQETLHPLLAHKYFIHEDGKLGVSYNTVRAKPEWLRQRAPKWMPLEMSAHEWALLRILQIQPLDRNDPRLSRWCEINSANLDAIIPRLVEYRLIAVSGDMLAVIHMKFFSGFAEGRIFTVFDGDQERLNRFLAEMPALSSGQKSSSHKQPNAAIRAYSSWLDITRGPFGA